MNELLTIQEQFQNYLMHPEEGKLAFIDNTKKISAKERLAIYSYAYKSRLTECLEDNFPVLNTYLGAKQFEEVACAYLDRYPSTYRSIRWFGDQLSDFLSDCSPYNEYPYLAELAQFEWRMRLVFDAKDNNILHIEEVAQIPPESWVDMYFETHPTVNRLDMSWNVVQIWQDIMDGHAPIEALHSATKTSWVLWRRDLLNRFCSLSEDEAWAIDTMMNGLSFGEICAGLCQWFDEHNAALRAASLLKGWINSGLISAIKIK
jgi:hypothetical protein